MAEDSVRRTDTVPVMGGFSGRQNEESPPRPRQADEDEEASPPRQSDAVTVRSDTTAAMRLLRERVLAGTRQRFGIGALHVPVFAEIVAGEAVEVFVSRLLSDQNHLVGHALGQGAAVRLPERFAAFEQGLDEARELLRGADDDVRRALDRVEAEFGRRLASLASVDR